MNHTILTSYLSLGPINSYQQAFLTKCDKIILSRTVCLRTKGTDWLQFILELQSKVIIACNGYRVYELNRVRKKCNGIKGQDLPAPAPMCIEFENITIPDLYVRPKGKKI